MKRRQSGSAILYTIVLSPIIFLSLALVVEAGSLQLAKERLRSAANLATVSAASQAADAAALGHLDSTVAIGAVRQALLDNLLPLQADFASATPASIAEEAEIAVITATPALDPLHPGLTLRRPTIEARIRVPVRSGLLSVAGLPPSMTMTVDSSADLRVSGGNQP